MCRCAVKELVISWDSKIPRSQHSMQECGPLCFCCSSCVDSTLKGIFKPIVTFLIWKWTLSSHSRDQCYWYTVDVTWSRKYHALCISQRPNIGPALKLNKNNDLPWKFRLWACRAAQQSTSQCWCTAGRKSSIISLWDHRRAVMTTAKIEEMQRPEAMWSSKNEEKCDCTDFK